MEIWELSALEMREGIAKGRFRALDALESCWGRISAVEPRVRAFVNLTEDMARKAAEESDARTASGEAPRPLEGVPVAIKDNLCLEGAPTTCGSKILEGFIPPFTATAAAKLLEAGAVPVGKTNLDEFAMGSSTENSAFGPSLNPWNQRKVPGGSSGGSAAAVAAGEVPLALGSDTGGSIRQPASFCGVVGLKPTYGRVSRYGLVAFASSLDQVGTFGRDCPDAALLTRVVSGRDEMDSTSSSRPLPDLLEAAKDPNLKGLRAGVPGEYFRTGGMAPGVEAALRDALKTLEELGVHLEDISLPHTEYAVATYYIVATAEASSNLARYDGVRYGYRTPEPLDVISLYSRTRREGFGAEVKRRIMLGTYTLSAGYYDAYYLRALKVRSLIRFDFERAFEKVDVVVCPTSPSVAFGLGERTADPLAMYLSDVYTISANLAALPAVSVPCGFGEEDLPVGLQVIGPQFEEAGILAVGRAYEVASGASCRRPQLWRTCPPTKV